MAIEARRSYLADTNVISNRRDVAGNTLIIAWLRHLGARVRLSVVTIAEMRRGLLLLDLRVARLLDLKVKSRELSRAARKRAWCDEVTARFANRIEPIDLAVAEKWAEISVRFPSLHDADKAIVATALAKGYGIATENLGDFRNIGVALVNPFDPATWDDDGSEDPLTRW